MEFNDNKLHEYIQHVKSDNLEMVHYGIIAIRKILREYDNNRFNEVISDPVIDIILNFS